MTDRESLRQTLVAYLEDDLGETLPAFDDAVALRDGLGLDSVDVVGLIMQVERQLRVRLGPDELAELHTVGDLLDLLERKIADRPAADIDAPTAQTAQQDAA